MSRRPANSFPFSAIVGQETLKLALLLNAVDPRVGGVLIRGEKGTAKSTAVRSLAAVLPSIDVVDSCRYGCDPGDPGSWCDECRARRESGPLAKTSRSARVVDLPVSATEDRLVGTLDFEKALKSGERAFHPGLLADANRGILYVDEVNLLDDHLVDTLLDAAAMGVNTVEREGVSFVHPARFILVGTMNPEEGDIRPQLLDRFGLCVDVAAVREPSARVEITRRRHAFEEDPAGFARNWTDAEEDIRRSIDQARVRLSAVSVPDEIRYSIAELAIRAGVDGHRADGVAVRAAAALAALEGTTQVGLKHVERVAPLVLTHRLRSRPFEEVNADAESLRASLMRAMASFPDGEGAETPSQSPPAPAPGEGQASIFEALTPGSASVEPDGEFTPALEQPLDRTRRSIAGKRQDTVSDEGRGRYRRAEPAGTSAVNTSDIAIDATIRAAARRGGVSTTDMACQVTPSDLQRKIRTRKVGATIVFCIDASGSMSASRRIDAAKAAVLELLVDAYQRRDRVAVVSFRGDDAEVVLAPTASVELANIRLRSLPTGGATPLALGLARSLELIECERRKDADIVPWLVLLTDGRGNVGLDGGLGSEDAKTVAARAKRSGVNVVVIDTTGGNGSGASARELARLAEGEYVRLPGLTGSGIASAVRTRL